ncbi:MAG: hypothetical protein ACMV1K_13410 [Sulfurospirillum sp.]
MPLFTITVENIKWFFDLQFTETPKNELKINFYRPINLPTISTSDSKKIAEYKDLKEEKFVAENKKFLEGRLDSALKSKYKNKMKDSFNTLWKINGFRYFMENEISGPLNKIDLQYILKRPDNEIICNYVGQYYQYHTKINNVNRQNIEEKLIEWNRVIKQTTNQNEITQLYIQAWKKYQEEPPFQFDKFKEMLIGSKECAYCGISLQQIDTLRDQVQIFSKSGRGFSFEIDRKIPNKEYSEENCCMICYWCNNAKTDEFSPKEFKKIARGIHAAWNARLNQNILFPENSTIWDVDHDSQLEK